MTKLLTALLIISLTTPLLAQNLETEVNLIKSQRDKYLYGEAKGESIEDADEMALYLLTSQISLSVQSSTTSESQFGAGIEHKEEFKAVSKTYSNATLHNAERIIIGEEPDIKVFRYIKRADIAKIFKARENKIKEFTDFALKYNAENKIGDALRYYYWALQLLKSHPDQKNLNYQHHGKPVLYSSFLPSQINGILSNVRITINHNNVEDNFQTVEATIKHNNKPVQNLEYKYWTGRDWTSAIDAIDGHAVFEFKIIGDPKANTKIKIEYVFKHQAQMDHEVEEVLEAVKPTSFSAKSTKSVSFRAVKPISQNQQKIASNLKGNITTKYLEKNEKLINLDSCFNKLEWVVNQLKIKNIDAVYNICTPNGKETVKKLLAYGNVKVLASTDTLKAFQHSNLLKMHSIPMRFKFKNGAKEFIENVVFHFNNAYKITDVTFGLNNSLTAQIESKPWPEADKLTLIDFLEHYKTAYALKRLEYIESIYSNDALIITGTVVKRKALDMSYQNNNIIKYNTYNKKQYIKKLGYIFNAKEYVNLKFEDIAIIKGSGASNKYGIQLKQYYYSSNYADTGYLFLLADLSTPLKPVIHVRTWQENKDTDGRVFDMSDF